MLEKYKIIKNPLGYFEVNPKPSPEELQHYYSKKYFQESNGSYQQEYSEAELKYFTAEAAICKQTISRYSPKNDQTLLDIGCGEGFFVKYFYENEWDIKCVDFSKEGITKHNPTLLPFFEQVDLFSFIESEIEKNNTYGLLNLDNVLEHVIDPQALLAALKKLLSVNSLARIDVPNDFSTFQKLLVEMGCATETWVCPPDHLSYFNKESLVNLLKAEGYEIVSLQVDFPIEQYLLNDNSNYWKDKNLGKSAHNARVICTNYMADTNIDRLIDYREAAADLEFGRVLTAYVKLA